MNKTVTFAGGCFWCLEHPFDSLDGVVSVLPGYAGGAVETANYEAVSRGTSGHREVIQVTYDPAKISYAELVEVFWQNIDPFDQRGQFYDKGHQYTTGIYFGDDEEKAIAEKSKAEHEKQLGKRIATAILADEKFYPAEDYHQQYYKKNPLRYQMYASGSGRKSKLKEIWGE